MPKGNTGSNLSPQSRDGNDARGRQRKSKKGRRGRSTLMIKKDDMVASATRKKY